MGPHLPIKPWFTIAVYTFINFEDYNSNELLDIFMSLCKLYNYVVKTYAIDTLTESSNDIYSGADESCANVQTVRNF
jgi:hypothetical protein